MKRLNIALMAGGDSSEREIALQSAAQIASALDPAKYDITLMTCTAATGTTRRPTDGNGRSIKMTSRSPSTATTKLSTTP